MKSYVPFNQKGWTAGYNYDVIGQIDAEPSQTESVNGLKVSGAIPEGAEFKAVATTTKWLKNPLFCYEITLNKNGAEVQPDGFITISIPCEYGDGYVVFINEETGEMQYTNSVYDNGYYVFVTDHLSQYGIMFDGEVKPEESKPEESKPEESKPVTPSTNNTPKTADSSAPVAVAAVIAMVSAAAIVSFRRKEQTK